METLGSPRVAVSDILSSVKLHFGVQFCGEPHEDRTAHSRGSSFTCSISGMDIFHLKSTLSREERLRASKICTECYLPTYICKYYTISVLVRIKNCTVWAKTWRYLFRNTPIPTLLMTRCYNNVMKLPSSILPSNHSFPYRNPQAGSFEHKICIQLLQEGKPHAHSGSTRATRTATLFMQYAAKSNASPFKPLSASHLLSNRW